MAAVTVRGLDDDVKERLRLRAARNGRSMEAEIRAILEAAVSREGRKGTGTRMHEAWVAAGLPELEIPPRSQEPARWATFD